LAEAVEEAADLFGPVDVVGVLVEEGQQQLFPSLAVAGLAGWAGPAGEVCVSVDFGGIVDSELAEPVVYRLELGFAAEDDAVELADRCWWCGAGCGGRPVVGGRTTPGGG
jgi:hypothetical protein